MMFRTRVRFRPNVRRLVFWTALVVMLVSSLTGLIWTVVSPDFAKAPLRVLTSAGPLASLTLGIGSLLVALVFGLIEFTNPTFHPESHLFDWGDVDSLHQLTRQKQLDEPTREWARSLADRISIVLPGRSPAAQGPSTSRTPAIELP